MLCPLDSGEWERLWKHGLPLKCHFLGWQIINDAVLLSSSIFGVVLIIVDFVLVIVDLSLPAKSREVGNALEAVSLLISFFFLADVLLRVYVEG